MGSLYLPFVYESIIELNEPKILFYSQGRCGAHMGKFSVLKKLPPAI